ncbi:MAG: LptF/LptG family permease, partial [Deltaproteobacteria bacterium]|nr:LptF/LptG family permease [Deltaproteobacteria bacterium]
RFRQNERMALDIEATFKDFLVPRKDPDRMTLSELKSYIVKAKSVGLSHIEYSVEIFNRILYPFSCPLMILLAIPFSLSSRRGGGAARGIAMSLLLGFSFWVVLSMSLALGQGRLLRPFTAAILPYVFYGSFALFMLRQRVH